MSDLKNTKNDLAWEKIFENDNLLKIIETHGLVEITKESWQLVTWELRKKPFCVDRVQLEVGFSGFYRK